MKILQKSKKNSFIHR
nr:Bm7713 [Brugia malayi]